MTMSDLPFTSSSQTSTMTSHDLEHQRTATSVSRRQW
ncbi:hypothetical protein CP532_4145 [Ophiocordyceps camponoti-leonardi (nom. inval.)]|nr:hypothetical protein CP532_4145 [Ophiocordyceps camponoti-leonardi (nom. inval.)]